MSEEQAPQLTKEEVMKQMKHHRSEYERLSSEFRKFDFEDSVKRHNSMQKNLLEKFKSKYKFYVTLDDEKKVRSIDWEEIEKLITNSYDHAKQEGYLLGYDDTGMPGIFVTYYGGGGSEGFVEEESDIRKYHEREEQRLAVQARKKK